MPNEIPDDIVTRITDKFLDDIGEHVTSARVFITYPIGDGNSASLSLGVGEYNAQRGQIHEWCIKCDERVRSSVRKEDEE